MECILFRHGIAVERADWDGEENLRPLTPKGVDKTREAASGLLHYMKKLLENSKVVRFLNTNHADILAEFEAIAAAEAL